MEIIFPQLKYTRSGTMSALESSSWKLSCLNIQLNARQSFLYPSEGAYNTQCWSFMGQQYQLEYREHGGPIIYPTPQESTNKITVFAVLTRYKRIPINDQKA